MTPTLLSLPSIAPVYRFDNAKIAPENRVRLTISPGDWTDLEAMRALALDTIRQGNYPSETGILAYFATHDPVRVALDSTLAEGQSSIFYIARRTDPGYENEPVGFVIANRMQDVGLDEGAFWNLNKLYILPAYQGVGLGKSLFLLCLCEGLRRGLTTQYLQTVTDYANAIAMYLRYGFEIIPPTLLPGDNPICRELIRRFSPEDGERLHTALGLTITEIV